MTIRFFERTVKAAGTPLGFLLVLLTGLASFVFYTTPFGAQVEEYLFDVRSRLKPVRKDVPDIVLITIDEDSIRHHPDASGKRISLAALTEVVSLLRQSAAQRVAVLLFPNVVDFEDPQTARLVEAVREDERFVLGTLGQYGDVPSGVEVPPVLRPLEERVFGVDTLKKRSNTVVRALPSYGYLGLAWRPLLPRVLAEARLLPDTPMQPAERLIAGAGAGVADEWYVLNFLAPKSFRTITVREFLGDPRGYARELPGKTVLVGQTAFREWTTQTRDQMAANTPLKGNADSYRDGEAILYVTANAVENLMTSSWLRAADVWVVVAQTALVTVVMGGVWAFGVVPAVLTVIIGWVALLFTHGLLFHRAGLFVPLADTAMFSSFAVVIGALARLNIDVRLQARIRTETEAKSRLARAQSSYLERFARAMSQANAKIAERLDEIARAGPPHPTDRELLARALSTCADFSEYLDGIMQSAIAEGSPAKKLPREWVHLAALFATVVQRFEAKLAESRIEVAVDCPRELTVKTNAQLLDNIVFNLVSNAVRYSPAGTRVTLEAVALARHTEIRVTDQGPGIAAEFQEKIFEKFYRVKTDAVYKIQGTGLGLYLCRYFAEKIDATVRCESQPGRGATFVVELRRRT